MCGRYALFSPENEIMRHFQLRAGFSMHPRYNIAPSQTIPIICQWKRGVEFARWGFIAPWLKPEASVPAGLINARFETISDKPTFKQAFANKRCLIPANGFFEWRAFSGKKQPFYIYLKNTPLFAFAGIYSHWKAQSGENWITCAIITQPAPTFLEKIYPRTPLIIEPTQYAQWLDSDQTLAAQDILPMNDLEKNLGVHAVSSKMNHPKFDTKEVIFSL